ncbi:MAG: hypothetical protein IH973_03430, partial [Myxococcales bacterium]|nr:hypothetical protein [Myxococcales bacterium]
LGVESLEVARVLFALDDDAAPGAAADDALRQEMERTRLAEAASAEAGTSGATEVAEDDSSFDPALDEDGEDR